MPLSAKEIADALRAKRLLADPIFADTLNEMVQIETERAILIDDPVQREASRQIVLAIGRIRATLEATVAIAESQTEHDALAREMEDTTL